MSHRERQAILRQVAALSRLDDASLSSLLPFFDEVCVAGGIVLAREGRLSHEFVVVAGGELELCHRGRASRLGPGDAFGWEAMRRRGQNDATVTTISPAHLLVMSHAQFRAVEALVSFST
jgi:CRP-like cAMP-binding protein